MVKPFSVKKELTARIHSLYRRNLQNRNSNKKIDNNHNLQKEIIHKNKDLDFSLDLNTGEIIVNKDKDNEKIIYLTNKEANILKILIESNGSSVSKEKY